MQALKKREKMAYFEFQPKSTLFTSKEHIFHIEFKFTKKKYGLLDEKIKFSPFLSKIKAD